MAARRDGQGSAPLAEGLRDERPGAGRRRVASGSQDTFNTLAATSHMIAVASALDDHVATYNSGAWLNNALKDTKDISNALIPNAIERMIGGMNQ